MEDDEYDTYEDDLTELNWDSLMLLHEISEPKLLHWLLHSGCSTLIRDGDEGFFIRPGRAVETRDGSIKDVISWLVDDLSLGKRKVEIMSSFKIIYINSLMPYNRRLWFLKCNYSEQIINTSSVYVTQEIDVLYEGEDGPFADASIYVDDEIFEP